MMKFLHTADIHLDSPLRGLSQHDSAPVEEIRGATRRALENIVDLALDESVNFVLIAGDLYDGDWDDFSTGHFFNAQMRRLDSAQIPAYVITGNHDAASKTTKSLNPPKNVHMLSVKKPETLIVADHPVAIHGQGFATQHVQDNLALDYPEAVENHFNIGMLHTSLAGDPHHDPYAPCSIQDLTQKDYQYWALGHIHLHSIVHQHPHIVFSGNPQGRHVGETGTRGCYIVEVDDDLEVSETRFVPTDIVRWEAIEIDLSGCDSIENLRDELRQQIGQALDSTGGRLLALRLILTGATQLHDQLHADHSQWHAECVSIAAEIDEEQIWFERLKVKTAPLYDPKELAQRDELTALVLNALDHFEPSQIPKGITDLQKKLSTVAHPELKDLLDLDSADTSEDLRNDVAAIVLQSIASSSQ